tara:strand:- start:3430 stop:4257 length:828 start_codon:yes stop_codon:yes gene_type:complete
MIILSMIRPLNVLISIISVFISAYILNYNNFQIDFFHTIIVVSGFTAISNLINDIFDIKTDKINRPKKPLISNKISYSKVIKAIGIILAITLFSLTRLNINAIQFVYFLILPIIITYTPIFKSIPLIGNILIGITLGSVFLFTEISLTGQIRVLWIPGILAIHLTILRELIKDIEDYKGDFISGIITFPVYFGIQNSINLYLFLSLLLLIWGGALPLFQKVNQFYSPTFLGFFSPWIFLTWYFILYKKIKDYKRIANLLKIATICGLCVFITFRL